MVAAQQSVVDDAIEEGERGGGATRGAGCVSGHAAFLEELPENLRGVAFPRFARDGFG
jgi:hypothetical protein